jgi:hypothetical protein
VVVLVVKRRTAVQLTAAEVVPFLTVSLMFTDIFVVVVLFCCSTIVSDVFVAGVVESQQPAADVLQNAWLEQ